MSAPSAFSAPRASGDAGNCCQENKAKVSQGARWMPWLTEAMKDVTSCDKPRVGANIL